jgi:DNA-binding response OmpR family regulator
MSRLMINPQEESERVSQHVLALEKDLFFAVRIRDTLRHHGMQTRIVRTLEAFEQGLTPGEGDRPVLVIVNISTQGLDWEEAIRRARACAYPVLAFGSHVDVDARARALAAGARRVVANAKFASDLPGLVRRVLEAPTGGAEEE